MIKIVLLGAGNIAKHLYEAFAASPQVEILQVYNRNLKNIDFTKAETPITDKLSDLAMADVYLLCTSDNSLSDLSAQLPFEGRLVAHVSGGMDMDVLSDKNRRSVFYPLQTFNKNTAADFTEIPICVEAEKKADANFLMDLANLISENTHFIDSSQRAQIHIAAVYVNNFVNYLYQEASEIMKEKDMDLSLLYPLMQKTLQSAMENEPQDIQTGPAKRGDTKTIQKHLNLLDKDSHKNTYKQLTNAILKHYGSQEL